MRLPGISVGIRIRATLAPWIGHHQTEQAIFLPSIHAVPDPPVRLQHKTHTALHAWWRAMLSCRALSAMTPLTPAAKAMISDARQINPEVEITLGADKGDDAQDSSRSGSGSR
jgi:hypothetical protein